MGPRPNGGGPFCVELGVVTENLEPPVDFGDDQGFLALLSRAPDTYCFPGGILPGCIVGDLFVSRDPALLAGRSVAIRPGSFFH